MALSVESVAFAHARDGAALAALASGAVLGLWSQVDPGSILASWSRLALAATGLISAAQRSVAGGAAEYLAAVTEAQGITSSPAGRVNPMPLAGVASDGRDLRALVELPAYRALQLIGRGQPPPEALARAGLQLDMFVRTQVADAGRTADGIATTVDRSVDGYVRVLAGGSCSRCILLAGQWYRWNRGFLRHPRCDCRHVPSRKAVADEALQSPMEYFEQLPASQQDATFGKAGAQAIRDGADISRVVNARRGVYTTVSGKRLTYETSGNYRANMRPMPEQIYEDAKGDREFAISQLRRFGYIF